jgi:hypothetical protein
MVKQLGTAVKNEITYTTPFAGTIRDVDKGVRKFEKNLSSKFEICEPFGQINQKYYGRISIPSFGIYYDIRIGCNGCYKPKELTISVSFSQNLLNMYESGIKSELKDIEKIIDRTFEKPVKSSS